MIDAYGVTSNYVPFVKSTEASKPVSIPTFGRIDRQHEKVGTQPRNLWFDGAFGAGRN